MQVKDGPAPAKADCAYPMHGLEMAGFVGASTGVLQALLELIDRYAKMPQAKMLRPIIVALLSGGVAVGGEYLIPKLPVGYDSPAPKNEQLMISGISTAVVVAIAGMALERQSSMLARVFGLALAAGAAGGVSSSVAFSQYQCK